MFRKKFAEPKSAETHYSGQQAETAPSQGTSSAQEASAVQPVVPIVQSEKDQL